MVGGGMLTGAMMTVQAFVPPWPVQVAIFIPMGFGFYLLHACILVYMTELAPQARGTAMATHALSYFSGQALGPIVYGLGFAAIGAFSTVVLAGLTIATIGITTAILLGGRRSGS